ncbi:hypothetical protein TRFO_41239 [Tritrichomonas foetus]|uniref:Uncharacterized protein n=1 Tax=Tritrichomonas foetus TaxID=1144522 RepID=A0A1J4L5H5_9EUKA|nr:hypothetical protein TRFO_41239 [Tritrichomonas foetus]|eukprot:OHT17181.1 hypothetical protein TRFO_41239 [Tritrichomonas foetus]
MYCCAKLSKFWGNIYKNEVKVFKNKFQLIECLLERLNSLLSRLLGFTENKFLREGNLITDMIEMKPYGKPFQAAKLPKLTLDFTARMPVLYYYHPDLVSSNFNVEYISAVYIKGQETIDYDLMYDVNSLSPNPRTHFYYYEDGIKKYYTPQSFVIVLGFYESD